MITEILKSNWTDKQKEIWKTIGTYTKLIIKGKTEDFLKYFHQDYSGRSYIESFPINKADITNELKYFAVREVISYKIIPISAEIFNDTAIAHYFYSVVYKNVSSIKKTKTAINTDILLKQKDKWVLIGDYGGNL